MYAAPRIEVKEVNAVRVLLAEKFGKEFAKAAAENSDNMVSEKVVKKLSVTPPPQALVNGYLEEIARTYGVDWPKKLPGSAPKDDDGDDDDRDDPSGGQKQRDLEAPIPLDPKEAEEHEALSKATPPRDFGPASPLRVNPPSPSTDNLHPRVRGTGALDLKPSQKMQAVNTTKKSLESKGPVGGTIPDIDELAARFAALKK
jgi:vacuolar protein sorting-associated protein IST1